MKKSIVIALVVLTCLGLLFGSAYYLHPQKDGTGKSPSVFENSSGIAGTIDARLNQPRYLMGFAQNVFAGKVLRKIGAERRKVGGVNLPQSQYEVRTVYNIKGNLQRLVTIDDVTLSGETIVVGSTYIFAVRTSSDTGDWYNVGAYSGAKTLLASDQNFSDTELLDVVLKSPRTYELLNAYPNEIVSDYDIKKGYDANSFRSLTNEQKQEVYTKFHELIPPRPVPELLLAPTPDPGPSTEADWVSCKDGIDNDKDGLIDMSDPDCVKALRENNAALCMDNLDDDLDGLVDAADPDCAPFYPAPTPITPPPVPPPSRTPTTTNPSLPPSFSSSSTTST